MSSSSVRLAFLALFISVAACTAEPTIFVVRHAEKAQGGDEKDPDLSGNGRARAELIAEVLKDAGITAIYRDRTQSDPAKAAPIAR
jgi:broad specificity phosphatase PhoE